MTQYVEAVPKDDFAAQQLLQGKPDSQSKPKYRRSSSRLKMLELMNPSHRQSFSSWDDLTSSEFTIDEVDFAKGHRVGCDEDNSNMYMVKRLCKDWYNVDKQAAMRLASEAELLAQLSHTNTVSINATIGVRGTGTFGFVNDRIVSSLSEILVLWKQEYKKAKGMLGFNKDAATLEKSVSTRYTALFGIASGLRYLHSRQIIFRGLCPQVCGYDSSGTMKLFEFSSAKQIDGRTTNEDYKPTEVHARLPYLANEIIVGDAYGSAADVYSLGIVFWEVMALKKAKKLCGKDKSSSMPKLRCVPSRLASFMVSACSPKMSDRPDMEDMCDHLEAAILYGK